MLFFQDKTLKNLNPTFLPEGGAERSEAEGVSARRRWKEFPSDKAEGVLLKS